jgi:hypothetical protein
VRNHSAPSQVLWPKNARKVGAGVTAIQFALEARSKLSLNRQGINSARPARNIGSRLTSGGNAELCWTHTSGHDLPVAVTSEFPSADRIEWLVFGDQIDRENFRTRPKASLGISSSNPKS